MGLPSASWPKMPPEGELSVETVAFSHVPHVQGSKVGMLACAQILGDDHEDPEESPRPQGAGASPQVSKEERAG